MKKLFIVLTVLIGVVFFSRLSLAAEHPGTTAEHPGTTHKEHPGTTHEEEHPGAEHPGEEAMLSSEQIIKGIKAHISKVTKENNGVYPLYDSKEGKDLKLKLIRVHEDKVSYIKKEDAYFACTDFVTDDGKTKYDVDFWMKSTCKKCKMLEVYQTKIHKKDGIPRFTYQDDEIVPVESSHMAPEAPTGFMAPEERT